jgi:PleD family two-component response regulator
VAETILVVDDDPDITRFIELNLRDAGYHVAVAGDGEEALSKIGELDPDLVVLDVMMPKVDGFQVAEHLRQSARRGSISIIMLTAQGLPEQRVRGLTMGVDDYIVKPFDPVILLARVRATLMRAREMRNVSPTTGLPGSMLIEQEVMRRIHSGDGFALLYCDLDHFKAFNDKKGWDLGNRVIETAAATIHASIVRFAAREGFIGHIGGDDFVALVPPQVAERVAEWICGRFDERVLDFYSFEEKEFGWIEVLDRNGEPQQYPFVGISIGIASSSVRSFTHYAEAVSAATEMKQYAKGQVGSTYALDRRTS